MDNKHVSNTIEARSEGVLNNYTEPNISCVTDNLSHKDKDFDNILNKIKAENYSDFRDESSDLENPASIASIDSKNEKQQDQMCELASISYEKDVNVSESNSQEMTDKKLVDGKILRTHTSSLSTALPIINILSPKSGPHICLERCFKCRTVFRVLDSPLHICRIRNIDKQNEFLKIEPSLFVDSCLCEFCWKYLEKTYKSNKSKNRKEESYSEKKSKLLKSSVKKNVTRNQNQSGIISSHQVVEKHNEIENNQSKLNSHAICSVAQDRTSIDLKEAVESPNAIVNSVSIKRKSNVICDTISNKDAKKQKLNEKYSFYDNNSTDDNTTKSLRNKNIAHPNLSIDVDEDIQLNTKVPSINIEKDYSFDFSYINNDADILLYLKEKSQLLYNGAMVVSETADEFSKDYLKEQKTTLYNCFGDTKDSINASKPFIHPSSHLHQYSNQLSDDNIKPLIIKDITTTTSSPTQSNSIASPKKTVAANEGVESKFNNIRTKKTLPLCNSVFKLRNNIISTNSVSKVPNHLLTHTKPLLTSRIPYLPNDNQNLTQLAEEHLTRQNYQLPISIIKKKIVKVKFCYYIYVN
ncbi:putative leucine-rich repeat-containing protein DDB_G0290503 [Acyrthosiphon pisum]|uniref:Uncharacterized protein n=1 Tax=Acyrthosiphon pisum TaxID=7029 RepID=A0A8R2D3J0_ACYPI|nr:putative leucine-rich repeat-containing protein DDB_G0290503 [Acyrthosiphon pisum]|eukprot:XP_016659755.1 PREDICTED: putative leucine-rich repeat-containing protein DDB_G0290503 isoform X2 [Acyrthosiphon pisum]